MRLRCLLPLIPVLAWIGGGSVAAGEADDPAVQAARAALGGGQPAAVVSLLAGHAGLSRPGAERLLLARAQLALGRAAEALAVLKLGDAKAIDAWPTRWRGAAAMAAGEAQLAQGSALDQARAWLDLACRIGGEDVEVDRAVALLMEICVQSGDVTAAAAYAQVLWHDWPRSRHRVRGGLMLAGLLAEREPERAREILAGVRIEPGLAPPQRLAAAELLCRLLLTQRPGHCLVVAEQEMRTLAEPGRLPLYRALALAALDAREGQAAFEMLPVGLRNDPSAVQALATLRSGTSASAGDDLHRRIERAQAALDLGHADEARALVEPLAEREPSALALLAQIPGVPLARLLTLPAAQHPSAALALGQALVKAGRAADAWPLLQAALRLRDAQGGESPPLAAMLYWAGAAARTSDPVAADQLAKRLRALDVRGVETGLAWCAEAQERERNDDRTGAATAWRRAAELLPDLHPWQAPAAWRGARPLVEAGGADVAARRLLEGPAWAGVDPDHLRCRFLLVQVLTRMGLRSDALRTAESLIPLADAGQAERLNRMIGQLRAEAPQERP